MAVRKGDFGKAIGVHPSLKAFSRAFGVKIPKELNDWRPAWRRLLPFMARGIAQNIQGQGSPIGEKWADGSRDYELRKQREGYGRLELVRTGRTVAQLTSPSRAVSLTKRSVSHGLRGKKWQHVAALNFGRKLKGARPFMGWNRGMINAASNIMTEHAQWTLDRIVRSLNSGAVV